VELQSTLPTLAATGVVPFAVSYDPVAVLADFAATRGITFPLLSDEGSRLIRALGILNTSVEPTQEHYGIPNPGTYLIGEDGRVVDKIFHDTYRTRDAAATTLRERFGLAVEAGGPQDRRETGVLVAIAAMDSEGFVRGERIGLRVTIQIAPGVHIYGRPLPDGYIATHLAIEVPETVAVEDIQYPPPHAFHADWLDEELLVYEGEVTLATALTFAEQREDVTIMATLHFQGCTTEECFIPERLTFVLPMQFRPFLP